MAAEESATTRAPPSAARAGQSRMASAKWPRWFVANWASQPVAHPHQRAGHDRGAVDQQVDRAAGGEEAVGERGDAVEVAEVELGDLHAVDARERLAGGVRARRAGTTTCAPAAASARVVSVPMPL